MDIQNIVTNQDTEVLNTDLKEMMNDISNQHAFSECNDEDLRDLINKAMKLGGLYERQKWQAAKSQANRKAAKYFSYDGYNYEIHSTIAEAKQEAECAIEYFRDCLADQQLDPRSSGNFQQVGYGVVLAKSGYSVDHVVTQEDIESGNSKYEVGTEILSLFLTENQAISEGFVLLSHEDVARIMSTIDFLGEKALGDEYISFSEIHKYVEQWQEQSTLKDQEEG
ncbi:hypothetical protein A7P53_06435 [Acinetobacter defluvii]|uniref:hypothetical protein n=1 Tax=Acinetobacter defluvii TaxID=1871111 RepID=UPI0014906F6B|nr:hypothetical protein [Acinetobacter defluvii]NNP72101.1 hypothetical protein [Acinetobacter defluvii]